MLPEGPALASLAARPHLVTASVTIDASPDAVWDVLCDVPRHADWVENTIEVLGGEPLTGVGDRFTERARLSGMWTSELRWSVTEFSRPTRLTLQGDGARPVRELTLAYDLDPGDASTEVSSTYSYVPRFGPLGALLQLVVRGNVVADQCRSLRTLAQVVETSS